jgi:hypothetical protein
MKRTRTLAALVAAAGGLAYAPLAPAQIPPHAPGTVCVTPSFWCWVPAPGPVGAPCVCPTPSGGVPGTYQAR